MGANQGSQGLPDCATIECEMFGPGMFVSLLYTTPTDDSRLKLNFTNGDDHLLCVNPRYDETSLVLNSKLDGGWQHMECPDNFLEEKNIQTQIVVLAGEDAFDIYVDKGRHKYSYQYRDEVTKVKHIQYVGSGTGALIGVGKVLADFGVGKTVTIHSLAPPELEMCVEFDPSLPSNFTHENVYCHIGIRYHQNAVVRNSKRDGQWGMEERAGGMPFSPGKPFVLTVIAQRDGFEIRVNGNHFTNYRYRGTLSRDMSVKLCGGTFVGKIEYC